MALLLLPVVRWSRNERGPLSGLLIAESRVPAAVSARRPGLLKAGGAAVAGRRVKWLGCGRGGPEEARQFACDCDDRDVVRLTAGAHGCVEVVQALLATV
jgi:hypothetical protein